MSTIEARRAASKRFYNRNKETEKARSKAWRLTNPDKYFKWTKKNKEKRRAANRLHEYGLTHDSFLKMLKKQKGRCPICLRKMKRIDVDHNPQNRKSSWSSMS